MKSISSLLLFTALFTGILGCSRDTDTPKPTPGNPVNISARIAGQTTNFAFDLLQEVNNAEPTKDNFFVSPLSLHIALGMLLNGAEDDTREGILKAIRSEGSSIEELNQTYRKLLQELPDADKNVKVNIANSMWYRQGFTVKDNYKQMLSQIFDSEIRGEAFDDATVKKINQWASDKTQGKIEKVIDEIPEGMHLLLMNALYFKGDWKYRFDKKNTQDWDFRLQGGDTKKVKMMFTEQELRTYDGSNFKAFELPYSSGQYNMTVVVPEEGTGVGSVIDGFTNEQWKTITSGMKLGKTKVGLPRFTLEYDIQLKNILSKMGMDRAFEDNAQFSGISETDLKVGFVKQNTFLGVDETGTEAAAVTTIGMVVTSVGANQPRTIIADRPFLLIISEKTSDTVLFTGRIMNP